VSGPRRAAAIAALCLIWGSTWLVIKLGLRDLPPFLSAAARFTLAAVVLLVVGRLRGIPWPRGGRLHLGLVGLGLTSFALSYGAVYWAEQTISSGLTAILFATNPILVLLMAHFALHDERITVRRALGVALGFLGVVLIFASDLGATGERAPLAAAVALVSPLAAGAGSVGVKRWGHDVHPFTLTTLPMAYGALVLLAISAATEPWEAATWSAGAVAATAYLAVFGSVVAFLVFYSLLKSVAVSSLSLITYVFPVVAVVLGYLVLGETLSGRAALGAGAILGGIALATRGRRGAARPGQEGPERI